MDFPPDLAPYLEPMQERRDRIRSQLTALHSAYKKQEEVLKGKNTELKLLRAQLKRAISRIRYVEDVPGKRIPYFLSFDIEIPGPTAPDFTLVNQRLSKVNPIPTDGPFVATAYMAAFKLKTYSLAPRLTDRTNDPAAGVEIITPLTGRFRPICSTADPFNGAYIGPRTGNVFDIFVTTAGLQGGAWAVKTFRPGTIDFLWEVADEGSDRVHQNSPLMSPSRYLFSEFDRPLYLPTSDFYERGSYVRFSIVMTRDLGFAEVNFESYVTADGTFIEGNIDQINVGDEARYCVGLGGTLTFTMMGYKILQSESPAT